jgi:transcriptional regulator with XRE-family HTH domain
MMLEKGTPQVSAQKTPLSWNISRQLAPATGKVQQTHNYDNRERNVKTFGETIAHYRKLNSLTQRDLAEAMHVPLREMSELERDITDPNVFGRLDELSRLIKAPVEELYSLATHHPEHFAYRRKVENEEMFSMITLRRSRE